MDCGRLSRDEGAPEFSTGVEFRDLPVADFRTIPAAECGLWAHDGPSAPIEPSTPSHPYGVAGSNSRWLGMSILDDAPSLGVIIYRLENRDVA